MLVEDQCGARPPNQGQAESLFSWGDCGWCTQHRGQTQLQGGPMGHGRRSRSCDWTWRQRFCASAGGGDSHVEIAEGEGWLSQQEAALVHRVLTDTGKRQHIKTSMPSHSLQSLRAAEST
ncbi:LOW QUALITY PROTEIN: hypothetical protein Nmel_010588 [Mimus melanotis]